MDSNDFRKINAVTRGVGLIFFVFGILFIYTMMHPCVSYASQRQYDIHQEIESLRKKLPIKINEKMTMFDIFINNKNVFWCIAMTTSAKEKRLFTIYQEEVNSLFQHDMSEAFCSNKEIVTLFSYGYNFVGYLFDRIPTSENENIKELARFIINEGTCHKYNR